MNRFLIEGGPSETPRLNKQSENEIVMPTVFATGRGAGVLLWQDSILFSLVLKELKHRGQL